jgi:hypothetical protein
MPPILHAAARLTLLSITSFAAPSKAGGLPEPPRAVYKCEVAGKVSYSDEPCLGAKRVELEPTRGLNKSTGQECTGKDVQRERQREAFAEGLRPLTGMDADQLKTATRRQKLKPAGQQECRALDRYLPRMEAEERSASGTDLLRVQDMLLSVRKRARELGC